MADGEELVAAAGDCVTKHADTATATAGILVRHLTPARPATPDTEVPSPFCLVTPPAGHAGP
jgi:hypothetical protein